ncbi:MAG: hypothetical protein RLZZ15_1956 [Verrucomicrobiota bacterium]|jgi:hypothetical protein
MPTPVILATHDAALAAAWERQLAPGRTALRLDALARAGGSAPGFAAVVVLDAIVEEQLPPGLVRCPTVFVGEPRSLPFEQARLSGRAKLYLSYEESAARLGELLPLLEELAEKQSMLDLVAGRQRRADTPRAPASPVHAEDPADLWDLVEGAIENLEARDRLIGEFRRASRHLLRASHVVFFLREAEGFRADRGTSFFDAHDPLVGFFENHPVVIDGTNWEGPADPVAELAIRNRLALWGARLLAPVHDNGRLLGLVALGVREDGQPYDAADRERAVFFARLLRHVLTKSAQFSRLQALAELASLGAKYLPGTLVLGPDEGAPRHVPLIVRELVGRARHERTVCRAAPTATQPFRVAAGLIAETGGAWAFWQEASDEVSGAAARERAGQLAMLRELGLTLNHELGNALVSLATLRLSTPEQPLPPAILEAVKSDVTKLETLNNTVAMMQLVNESQPAPCDVPDLVRRLGAALGLRVDSREEPLLLNVAPKALEFALRALLTTVSENRGALALAELKLQVRSTGTGAETTVLLALSGRGLELEGILPAPIEGGAPNQGRLGVFLAKEILRLHHGDIHAGPGMDGTEIQISVRAW